MNSFSKQLNKSEYEIIIKKLSNFSVPNTVPYVIFTAEYYKTKIYIYKTLKFLTQGKNIDKLLNYLKINQEFKIKQIKNVDNVPYIGCDEVGVGDFFGGITICCCLLEKNTEKIKNLGVTDSKNLTDQFMISIYPKLIKLVKCKIIEANPLKYNELVDNYKNTHIVKAVMHNIAIKKLKDEFKCDNVKVVLDQFVNEKKYYEYLKIAKQKIQKIDVFVTGAEKKYLAVACASIIARVNWLEQIKKIEKELNITKIPLGSSNPKIIDVAKKIKKEDLKYFCKIGFKTIKKI